MKVPEARPLSVTLGAVYVGFGIAEVVTHLDDTTLALLFWGGSLLGGGVMVLVGTFLRDRHRPIGLSLLTVGAVLGMNATAWTIAIPLFAVFVLVRSYRNEDAGLMVSQSSVEGPSPV
jgi:hypothetical protein